MQVCLDLIYLAPFFHSSASLLVVFTQRSPPSVQKYALLRHLVCPPLPRSHTIYPTSLNVGTLPRMAGYHALRDFPALGTKMFSLITPHLSLMFLDLDDTLLLYIFIWATDVEVPNSSLWHEAFNFPWCKLYICCFFRHFYYSLTSVPITNMYFCNWPHHLRYTQSNFSHGKLFGMAIPTNENTIRHDVDRRWCYIQNSS